MIALYSLAKKWSVTFGFVFMSLALPSGYSLAVDVEELKEYTLEQISKHPGEITDELTYMLGYTSQVENDGQEVLFRSVVRKLVETATTGYEKFYKRRPVGDVPTILSNFRVSLIQDFSKTFSYCNTRLHGEIWSKLITDGPETDLGPPLRKDIAGKIWNILTESFEQGGESKDVAFQAAAGLIKEFYSSMSRNLNIFEHLSIGVIYVKNQAQLDFFKAIRSAADRKSYLRNFDIYNRIYKLMGRVDNSNIALIKHAISMSRELWKKRGYPNAMKQRGHQASAAEQLVFLESLIEFTLDFDSSSAALDESMRSLKEQALLLLLNFMPNFHLTGGEKSVYGTDYFGVSHFYRTEEMSYYLELMGLIVDGVDSQAKLDYIDELFSVNERLIESPQYVYKRAEVNLSEGDLGGLLNPRFSLLPTDLAGKVEGVSPKNLVKIHALNLKVQTTQVKEKVGVDGGALKRFCRNRFL